jgi:hypothetical protein
MNKSILDQLEEAERLAIPAPWNTNHIDDFHWNEESNLILLMRNNIRKLIELARLCETWEHNHDFPGEICIALESLRGTDK